MRNNIWLKLLISVGAFIFILIHLLAPTVPVDAITIGLLIVVILPWLSTLIESAELPGGWKVTFREIQAEQKQQRSDLDTLKFLVSHFVTDDELAHLKKLSQGDLFPFKVSAETGFFEKELRRLRALGLIAGHPGKGIGSLLKQGGDVKEHFFVTDRGMEYLRLREQVEATETGQK